MKLVLIEYLVGYDLFLKLWRGRGISIEFILLLLREKICLISIFYLLSI